MHYIKINGISDGYKKIIDYVLKNGKHVTVRGNKDTIEVSPVTIHMLNPNDRVFFDETRKMNIGFSIAEFLWICGGRNDVQMLDFYNSKIKMFSDDGETFHGSYGKRLSEENSFLNIVKKLKNDNSSRQAVLSIYDGNMDLNVETKDVPCTISFQFLIRENKLNMVTNMRSNDLNLGFPNDIFNFTMIQLMIANSMKIGVGTYTHNVGSLHIYMDDEEKMIKIKEVEKIHQINDLELSDISQLLAHERIIRFSFYNELFNSLYLCDNVLSDKCMIVQALHMYRLLKEKRHDIVNKLLDNEFYKSNVYAPFFYRSLKNKTKQ